MTKSQNMICTINTTHTTKTCQQQLTACSVSHLLMILLTTADNI